MRAKRILIVDDDEDIRRLLELSLRRLGPEYEIVTAQNSVAALALIEKENFDLVVTDYMMPGMTGIDLARAVRRIAPDTHVVLMTAYGNTPLQETTKFLGLDGYVRKPFKLDRIQEIVKQAVQHTSKEPEQHHDGHHLGPQALARAVLRLLQQLHVNAGVYCVLLINSEGYPVHVVGRTDDLEVSGVSALVAANFLAAMELASLLGNQAVFKSSYHEGDDYNIYAYDVNGAYLLAVVFDARLKPGTVWFYTKQTAVALAALFEKTSRPTELHT